MKIISKTVQSGLSTEIDKLDRIIHSIRGKNTDDVKEQVKALNQLKEIQKRITHMENVIERLYTDEYNISQMWSALDVARLEVNGVETVRVKKDLRTD